MLLALFESGDWITLITGSGFGAGVSILLVYNLIKSSKEATDNLLKSYIDSNNHMHDSLTLANQKIEKLENFQETTLVNLIQEDVQRKSLLTRAFEENTKATQRVIAILDDMRRD